MFCWLFEYYNLLNNLLESFMFFYFYGFFGDGILVKELFECLLFDFCKF